MNYTLERCRAMLNSLGVNIARQFDGGYGGEVKVGVVEYGFATEGHPDHLRNPPEIVWGKETDYQPNIDHGTMTLGVLGADINDFGAEGICPNSRLLCFPHHGTPPNVPIAASLEYLAYGDILLLEEQTYGDLFPCETFRPTREEIDKAVTQGIVVVEAAGNGGKKIDRLISSDSGAVMVGSTHPGTNYGERIDVIGPGYKVVSTLPDGKYTKNFSGTSSASAVVAGVCALINSVIYANGLPKLDSRGFQSLFRECDKALDIDKVLRGMFQCADYNGDGIVGPKDYWKGMLDGVGFDDKLKRMRLAYDQQGKKWPSSYVLHGEE